MTDVISFVQQTNTPGSSSGTSSAQLTDNFDTFLTLLTAQVQNQDPLSPTDATQFTEQLVQFSGVEQQIQSNQNLEALLAANSASTSASLANYLGQEVEIDSAQAGYHGQDVTWAYQLESTAESATMTVLDSNGRVVYTEDANTASGSTHEFTWDGTLSNGDSAQEDDIYQFQILATDDTGASVSSNVSLRAQVIGVDMSNDAPAVTTDSGIFSYSDLLRVTSRSSTGTETNSAT